MTPGDYRKKENFNDIGVYARVGDEDHPMYGGSAPARSTLRSRRSAKSDMERAEEDGVAPLTRKESAVGLVFLFTYCIFIPLSIYISTLTSMRSIAFQTLCRRCFPFPLK